MLERSRIDDQLNGVVVALAARFGPAPHLGVVLGSGVGGVVDALTDAESAPSAEVGLPSSSVQGHASRVVVGKLGGARVAVLSGRVHLYEGRSPEEVVRGVRALARWGVARVLLTNASGGLTRELRPGQLVVVTDHINLLGASPLEGPDVEVLGPRFVDLADAYDPTMRADLHAAAGRLGVPLVDGVYAALRGPSYETAAEVRMLRALGADVAGMSTVPEVIALAQLGVPRAAISLVTNPGAGLGASVSHGDVTRVAGEATRRLIPLLKEVAAGWCP